MRSRLAILASLLLTVAIFVGCTQAGGNPDADPNKVQITVWQGFKFEEVAMMQKILLDFEKEWETAHPGKDLVIDIKMVSYDDMIVKLRTAALAHQTPDVAFVDSLKISDLVFGKAILPLEDLKAFKSRYANVEDARKQFVHASFDAGRIRNKGVEHLYALPVQTTTLALFWNKKMFRDKADKLRAAGLDPNRPPNDWDELVKYARILENPTKNIYGYAMSGSLWFMFPLYNQYCVEWVKYDNKGRATANLNTPQAEAALKRIYDLYHTDKIEAGAWKRGAKGPDQGFVSEEYAMIFMGPWYVEKFQSAGLDFDISLIPKVPEAEAKTLGIEPLSSSNVGGQSGVILREAKNPDVAYDLIEYFISEKAQRVWAEKLGQIPVRLSAWDNLNMSKFPYLPKFMEQLKYAKRLPQIPRYGTLEGEIYNPEFDALMSNQQDVKTTLKSTNDKFQKAILDEMNEALEQ